jgi:hypothetical protein
MKAFINTTKLIWKNAWINRAFRINLFLEIILFIIMVVSTYFFLNNIDYHNEGKILNDWILKKIPSIDVSIPITFLMTSAILLFTFRCISNPNMVVTFLFAFVLLLATRIITISSTRLIAPPDLIALKDPIGNLMYRSGFVTQDLFYSGHTASLFLLYLCSIKKKDRHYILFTVISVGILLLIQHVHYTVDIAFAPLFAYCCFWSSRKIMTVQNAYVN